MQGIFLEVAGIFDLIEPLVRVGMLVLWPKVVPEKETAGYNMYTQGGMLVVCVCMKLVILFVHVDMYE